MSKKKYQTVAKFIVQKYALAGKKKRTKTTNDVTPIKAPKKKEASNEQ